MLPNYLLTICEGINLPGQKFDAYYAKVDAELSAGQRRFSLYR